MCIHLEFFVDRVCMDTNGICYEKYVERKNYDEAKASCISKGLILAEPRVGIQYTVKFFQPVIPHLHVFCIFQTEEAYEFLANLEDSLEGGWIGIKGDLLILLDRELI